jgi:ubiquinone/menaquinone biosynthesis C-methylase UbiE
MSIAHDYTGHWDEKFSSRAWGRYPPEDLVRFMGRRFRDADRKMVRVLEVGCGPGANIWFLHREGFAVHGIDISRTAIDLATARLATENSCIHSPAADLRVGNFSNLPWSDGYFDVVVDVFALYANTLDVISQALNEIDRVLTPGGLLYTKLWGTHTTGFGQGSELEPGTYDAIPAGPCANMGVTHFFTSDEIGHLFGKRFQPVAVDHIMRNDTVAAQQIEEFHCQFVKQMR